MKLWHDHPATPHQQSLLFDASTSLHAKRTQADVLIEMLRAARAKGEALGLPTSMRAGSRNTARDSTSFAARASRLSTKWSA